MSGQPPVPERATPAAGARLVALRLGPGEDACGRLLEEFDRLQLGGAAVVAAIGSFSSLTYAVAVPDERTIVQYRDRQRVEGAIEVCGLQGHLGRQEDGTAGFHLHGVFALEDGRVLGGHIFAATVLATLEVTLAPGDGLDWEIVPFTPPGDSAPAPGLRYFRPRGA